MCIRDRLQGYDVLPFPEYDNSGYTMSNNLGNKLVMANNIKHYMKLQNKTRQDVCEALNIAYTTFADWVNAVTRCV